MLAMGEAGQVRPGLSPPSAPEPRPPHTCYTHQYCVHEGYEFEGYVGEPDGQQEEGREGESDDRQQESEGENGDRLEISGECEVREASNLPPYSHTPGCNYPCDNATPLDFFSMLLTDDILDSIMTQTNLYADQYMSMHNLPPR